MPAYVLREQNGKLISQQEYYGDPGANSARVRYPKGDIWLFSDGKWQFNRMDPIGKLWCWVPVSESVVPAVLLMTAALIQ